MIKQVSHWARSKRELAKTGLRVVYAVLFAEFLASQSLVGQNASNSKQAPNIPIMPPLPPPIDFRQLLTTTNAVEREKILASRPEPKRQTLEKSIREYISLPDAEREARLCSLQLRLYLSPLLQVAPSNRVAWLEAVPKPDRKLVEERLQFWDRLPMEIQRDFLTNQLVLRYIFRPETTLPNQAVKIPGPLRLQIEKGIAGWNLLPEPRRREILENFRRLFDLSDREKARVLDEFSDAERQRMQVSLQIFGRLAKPERERCVSGFQKFASLSPQEREQFLSNVELWQKLSAADRHAWQSLVTTLSVPQPPLPAPPLPALPPVPVSLRSPASQESRAPAAATNGQ